MRARTGKRRWIAGGTATLAVAALVCGPMVIGRQSADAATDGGGARRAVALVTGDRVLLGRMGGSQVMPVAGEGREGVQFSIHRQGGHTYVIPTDAADLVANGRLDRQLFDVTLLDQQGYATGGDLPVIVQGGPAVRTLAGTRNARPLAAIGGEAVHVARGDSTFWRSVTNGRTLSSGISKIWLDAKLNLLLDRSVPQIGAPDAWKAGYTGKGVKVGVLDSGVDATHPDLAGRIAVVKNYTTEPDTDLAGHGTHVASTIASVDTTYRGVAPDASLYIAKVCVQTGQCAESNVLAAMEWASTEQHVDIVNMSMGGVDSEGVEPMEEAINRLTAQNGTLFVLGAGNDPESVASPATADAALSVGAVNRDNSIAPFSAQGPRRGDYALKPDLTAPGVGIVAARSKDSQLGNPGDTHVAASGTSMSSPHAAGAAALLAQEHPDWPPAQLKAALMASATPTPGVSPYRQGAGRVDLTRAIAQKVVPDQGSVSFGYTKYPHTDDQPITRRLTYRNTGATDVTLKLEVRDTTSPDGSPATIFTLSTTSLTVPAGGTASVDLTADTTGNHPDGNYTAQVVATGPDTTVHTALSVTREVESYDLTIKAVDRNGNPTADFLVDLGGYARFLSVGRSVDANGVMHIRAPRGFYVLDVEVLTGQDGRDGDDLLVAPWLDLSADRAITVDARTATPVSVTVQRKDASLVFSEIGFTALPVDGNDIGAFISTPRNLTDAADLSKVRTAQIGPDAPAGRFIGAQQAAFAVAGPDGHYADSPYVYNLAWFTPNKAYTGTHNVHDADLAKVRSENLAQGSGNFGIKGSKAASAQFPDATFPGLIMLPMKLPSSREELFTTEGVAWTTSLFQGTPTGLPDRIDAEQDALARTYQRGRQYTERWNGAVFGPSLPGLEGHVVWANQVPDRQLSWRVPLFGMAADTVGESTLDTSHIVVYRDGVKVCESDDIVCRLEGNQPQGRYRTEVEGTRSLADTSTKVSVVWEVTSDGTPALPVQVVRFAPALDAANSAPGNHNFAVPVSVQRNPGAKPACVASLTVDVSYDDGATWRNAPVAGGQVQLRHPATGYVSLRAKATDTAGNTVEQTIIRAYRLR